MMHDAKEICAISLECFAFYLPQEPGRCRRIFSKHTLSHGLFNTFTNFSLTGALLTLQGSLIVFIALCDSTFGVPANKLRSADGALHNLKQSAHNNVHSSSPNKDIDDSEVMKVKRDLNLEKIPESFNVLDRQMAEGQV